MLPENQAEPSAETATAANSLSSEIEALARGQHSDPLRLLGPHLEEWRGKQRVVVRVYRPDAETVNVIWRGLPEPIIAARSTSDGLFVATLPVDAPPASPPDSIAKLINPSAYKLRVTYSGGRVEERHDPYAFAPILTDYDIHLLGEGTHYFNYEKLGAHVREIDGVRGVHFAVWAPNARRVSVVGDFNRWDGRVHPMAIRGFSGIWELFIPELGQGDIYKFEIVSHVNNHFELKADPYGFDAEVRPKSGSIVYDIGRYQWHDSKWMAGRAEREWLHAPLSIYEVHLGSWRRRDAEGYRWLTYPELAEELIPYAKAMGFTHLELMPVTEHPYDGSWGYQTVGYFAPTSRFGEPDDFKFFVDRCHQEGLGIILDWTPAHFPRDAHGLAFFDGTHLYEHADPRRGTHPDWGTLVFNYGRNEVQNFLVSNALFWLDKYHVDGLRVDAVASMLYLDYSRKAGEWIPNQYGGRENLEAIAFLKKLNEVVHVRAPGILMIAEESTSWPAVSRPTYVGGLGFDLKWNMGWMNDTLRYFELDPIHRKYHHNDLTFSMMYAFTENFILPLSHDEVVHGKRALLSKMPGDDWQKFANLRLLFSYMYAHPGKKLLFMGSELAERHEWSETRSLEWTLEASAPHVGVQRIVADLNRLHTSRAAFHDADFEWKGFEWLEVNDVDNSSLTFIRWDSGRNVFIVVACNFTPVVRRGIRVGVPREGFYHEIFNSDSSYYGGSNVGNSGGVRAEPIPWNGQQFSIAISLPPLAAVYFEL